ERLARTVDRKDFAGGIQRHLVAASDPGCNGLAQRGRAGGGGIARQAGERAAQRGPDRRRRRVARLADRKVDEALGRAVGRRRRRAGCSGRLRKERAQALEGIGLQEFEARVHGWLTLACSGWTVPSAWRRRAGCPERASSRA